MAVSENLISPQNCRTSFDLIQDVVMGLWILSEPSTAFTEESFMKHWYALRYPEGVTPTTPVRDTRGVALLAYLLPPNLFMDAAGGVRVRQGQWCAGRLTKKVAAAMIEVITRDFSGRRAVQFMSDAQRLSVSVLFEIGYTCGIRDTISTTAAETAAGIDARLSSFAASDEAGAMHELHRIMDRACGKCTLRPNNNFTRMTASGAKGSVLNTFQISVAVGQQLIAGNRVGSGNRSLPCFRSTAGPRARGFVLEFVFRRAVAV